VRRSATPRNCSQGPEPILVQGPRNKLWTGTGMPASRVTPTGQLVGRVALATPDPDLAGGSTFTSGRPAPRSTGSMYSVGQPPSPARSSGAPITTKWCGEVAVIRAFAHRNGQIFDFADDVLRPDAPATPFRKRGLSIPTPPSRSRSWALPKPMGKSAAAPKSRAETPVAVRRMTPPTVSTSPADILHRRRRVP